MGFPTAVSASGDVVVGYATGAMVWTAQRRAMSLQSLLGPTVPPGWTLSQGLGVSGDGLHVVGWGQNPMGRQEAWLTVLTPELLWCAANCDNSTTAPALNVNDFVCFLNKFAAGDTTANCDQSAALPSLNVNDFTCFLNAFRLYECFIDAIFSKAKGGGDGIGLTKAGKGVKVMVLVDARGLPVAVTAGSASPHESKLVQGLFDFMLTLDMPERIIGDKACDSDSLDENLDDEGIEMIAPHRKNRAPRNGTQDSRPPRRYKRRWIVERTISWFQNFRRLRIAMRSPPHASKASSTSAAPSSCSGRFTDSL